MKQSILIKLLVSGVRMAENRNLEPLFHDIMETAFDLLIAEHGYLVLLDEDGSLDFRVRIDSRGKGIEKPKIPISYTILNSVIQEGEATLIGDARRHPDFLNVNSVHGLNLRSVLCVPLIAHRKTLGALYFENRSKENFFSEEDLLILKFFAAQVAISIDNAALNDNLEARVTERTLELEAEISERKLLERKLTKTARTDALTQVFNRGRLMELATYLFETAQKDNSQLGVMMIDIDRFKRVNDQFGHQTGDQILKTITARMQCTIRSTDVLGRYGGEEFTVISPQSTQKSVCHLAERVRLAICSEPISVKGHLIPIAVSIGVACLDAQDENLEKLINRADEALIRAKNKGRNQVVGGRSKMSLRQTCASD